MVEKIHIIKRPTFARSGKRYVYDAEGTLGGIPYSVVAAPTSKDARRALARRRRVQARQPATALDHLAADYSADDRPDIAAFVEAARGMHTRAMPEVL